MIKRIGIILPYLHDSQMVYECLKEANYLVLTEPKVDISVFYEDFTPSMIRPIFGIFNASEIFSYEGTLIATTLQNARVALNTIKPERKIFYIYDLEWIRHEKSYIENIQVYQNADLELVCPSEDYASEIENYCNRRPRVVERFHIKDIVEC